MFEPISKLRCVARELALRIRVYPKLVANGKMKQETADREIELMQAIVKDYQQLVEQEKLCEQQE